MTDKKLKSWLTMQARKRQLSSEELQWLSELNFQSTYGMGRQKQTSSSLGLWLLFCIALGVIVELVWLLN